MPAGNVGRLHQKVALEHGAPAPTVLHLGRVQICRALGEFVAALRSNQIVLARRPRGTVVHDDFAVREATIAPLADGDVLLETLAISIDPAIRGWLDDRPSYLPPVAIGSPVRALGLAVVADSRDQSIQVGDIVRGFVGWQDRVVVNRPDVQWDRIQPRTDMPIEAFLGVLGMTGLTAWVGINEIGRPERGETVLVTAAAGAVGSVAVQLAKAAGARVIAVAGGPRKCEILRSRLGVDVAIDRYSDTWSQSLRDATPDGIDMVFENVGGPMFEVTIDQLNNHARIALCGLIDGYNQPTRPGGPANFGMLLTKRIRLEGFIIVDYMQHAREIEDKLAGLVLSGNLDPLQTVVNGFDQLPGAFIESFVDEHVGKLVVRL